MSVNEYILFYLKYRCDPAQEILFGLNKNSLSPINLKSNLTIFAGAFQLAALYTSPVFLSIKQ